MENEEFYVVPLSRDEQDRDPEFELKLVDVAQKALSLLPAPTILVCDELGALAGFREYAAVYFLNKTAFNASEAFGLKLQATLIVRKSEIPKRYTLLIGEAIDAPKGGVRRADRDPKTHKPTKLGRAEIRKEIRYERKRLWDSLPKPRRAKTGIGRMIQATMGASRLVANRVVERVARERLESAAEEDGPPN
jgi:hypothetical protein